MTSPDGVSASAGPQSAGEVVLDLPAVIDPTCVIALCHRLEAILDDHAVSRAAVDTSALWHPDLATLDALARLQLTARQRGNSLRLIHMTPPLRDLLVLSGLYDTLA
jgi:ABC-type transporter Mla MlaB component